MTTGPDLATTLFLLPPDAKLLAVRELAPRLRAALGALGGDEVVATRPGFRVTARQVASPLAMLLSEFRTASRLTDAVHRFSRANGQDPEALLDLSFDALVACIGGRILVDAASSDAHAAAPSLAAGQAFAGMEVEALVRALDDTEVYRVRMADGTPAALKVARDARAADILAHEADLLALLDGGDTPRLLARGTLAERAWLALEWRDGVPVSVAAQQARAARDRGRLAAMVTAVLGAYARLHARGIAHGDIHTGNILVEDDGRVALIDFGRASRFGGAAATDLRRAGVPHFHDPELAAAVLAGALPPAATPAAEQHALAMLAYLLLTGLYAIEPAADRTELLARIVVRPPLPFTARGVSAWPRVEAVLRRALAKQPGERFADTGAFARAFRAASRAPCPPVGRSQGLEPVLEALRAGEPLPGIRALPQAWLSLRAALARSDAELLAAADVCLARAGAGWEAMTVAAEVARARGDRLAGQAAIDGFGKATARGMQPEARLQALLAAARLLDGAVMRGLDCERLRLRAKRAIAACWKAPQPAVLHAALALAQAGAIPLPADICNRLDALRSGSAWLWALAHDAFPDGGYLERARVAPRPPDPLLRGLRHLRLYRLTGEARWLDAARRRAAALSHAAPGFAATLLAIELEAPARSELPPWQASERRMS